MANEPIIEGSGFIDVKNLGDATGKGFFVNNSIYIKNVDGTKVNAGQFVANPAQLTDQTQDMDVNYDYSGPVPIPSGGDTVHLNPQSNVNPIGANSANSDIVSGSVYAWPVDGNDFRKSNSAAATGHMTYQKRQVNN